jgi:apolipoprotein D and lipocalin family protein
MRFCLSSTLSIAAVNEANYLVLSTDYDNYSIVYYCKNIEENKSSQFAWLLSRQSELNKMSPAALATANGLIDTHFDRSVMHQAVQSSEQCDPRE